MVQKKCYLSLARIICALAVVMIHTNTCFQEFNVNGCWVSANIIDCGLGFAVPIFIMISGAALIDYRDRYDTKKYFVNRISKTVIPYIIWSLIGKVYGIITGNDGTFFIYYFFINLFGIYLCIPLFSYIKKEYREKVILYVVIVSFIVNYLLPFFCSVTNLNYIYKIPFETGSGFIIYALLGYLISKKEIPIIGRVLCYITSIIGFVLHIGGTYYSSIEAGYIVDVYRGYTNLPCFMSTIGVFVLIKQIGVHINNKKVIDIIDRISGYTFSVYLLHYYVINSAMMKIFTDTHSLAYRLGTPIIIFVICVLVTWVIRKIPFIRRILP